MNIKIANKSSKTTQSLEKALSIIELLSNSPSPMRLQDISSELNIPTSTALRLLNTLLIHKYVNQDSTNSRYSLSLKIFHLGCKVSDNTSFLPTVRPYLEALSSKLKHSINFAIPQDNQLVIMDVVGGTFESQDITTRPGRTVPLYCTALGRAILSHYSPQALEEYLAETPLESYTQQTITDKQQLLTELQASRTRGYSYDSGEFRAGIAGTGAAIFNSSQQAIACISVATLATEATPQLIEYYGTNLSKTAAKLSQLF